MVAAKKKNGGVHQRPAIFNNIKCAYLMTDTFSL